MVLLLYTLHLSGNLARFLNNLVAPQVDVPNSGRVLQARTQEPPEVYSNLLPPSVGETTGGIHPHAVRHKYLCPSGGKHPKAPQVDVSTAGKHRPARTEDRR